MNYQRDLEYKDWPEEQKERMRKAARNHYNKNKEKAKLNHQRWAQKNKDSINQKQRETKRKRKLFSIEYLGGCCSTCKQIFHPACFEFHHKDPTTKDRDPSKMFQLSLEKLKQELDKCVLLCANCHRMEHHKYES